jgi:N-acetylglucosaminyldiphosphoundecaprenol N-acetyl-beta-D-mannosaminyltransferase
MIINKLITSESEVLLLIEKALRNKNNLTLTYFNQHCFNIYNSDSAYRNLLNNRFDVFPDGIGINFALKFFGRINIQKFNATDLNEKIFNYFSKQGTRIFLVGGMFEEKYLTEKITQRKINLGGYEKGFFKEQDSALIIDKIKNAFAEAIIIGMGVPRQEFFADQVSRNVENKIIICVGNFLEFYLGTKKRAPAYFRNSGFEWLFRLSTEPNRLWRRYLIGIPLFFYNALKIKFIRNNEK